MAIKKKDIQTTYPLPVFNYRVSIGSETHAFSEVSGLNLAYEPITYKHGLSWLEGAQQMPGMRGEVNLSLKRGIVKNRSMLLEWISSVRLNTVEKRDITIDLCDEHGLPIISWIVYNAFPIKMEVPTFEITSNDIAVESLDLVANFLEIKYHD